MKLKQRATINITFVNSQAEKVKDFKDKHPKTTHNEIYLRGIESIEEKVK